MSYTASPSWISYENPFTQQTIQGAVNPSSSAQQTLMPAYSTQQAQSSVKGESTQQQAPAPSGGSGGGGGGGGGSITEGQALAMGYDWNNLPGGYTRAGQSVDDLANQARGEINAGYDQYFSTLDNIMNNLLPSSRTSMEGIASSQGKQAETTLGGQKEQGLAELATQGRKVNENQGKNLQSLAEDIRNQFKAGQIYLGARGAGDSSAANQYAYAIAKMGNQSRGGILQQVESIRNDIADRESRLNTTYNTELNNIKEQVNQKMMEIAEWFTGQQTSIQQAKASGQVQRGTDLANLSKQILGQAQQSMLMAQQEAANKRSMLDQWAMNNSTTINGLKSNMAALSQGVNTNISNPGLQGGITTDNSGNLAWNARPSTGYSSYGSNLTDEQKKMYGIG